MSERNGKNVTDGEKIQHIRNYLYREMEMHKFLKGKYEKDTKSWTEQDGCMTGLNKAMDKINSTFPNGGRPIELTEKT
jgi:hypothetical protein